MLITAVRWWRSSGGGSSSGGSCCGGGSAGGGGVDQHGGQQCQRLGRHRRHPEISAVDLPRHRGHRGSGRRRGRPQVEDVLTPRQSELVLPPSSCVRLRQLGVLTAVRRRSPAGAAASPTDSESLTMPSMPWEIRGSSAIPPTRPHTPRTPLEPLHCSTSGSGRRGGVQAHHLRVFWQPFLAFRNGSGWLLGARGGSSCPLRADQTSTVSSRHCAEGRCGCERRRPVIKRTLNPPAVFWTKLRMRSPSLRMRKNIRLTVSLHQQSRQGL